jgi:hypothetical protein
MAYKIIVDPTAGLDIIESIEWYNKAQPNLGIKFYKQVQAVFKTIRKNPSAFAIRYKINHTATVKKVPLCCTLFHRRPKENHCGYFGAPHQP